MSYKGLWENVRNMVGEMKEEGKRRYGEVWLPGFSCCQKDSLARSFVGGSINGETIIEVLSHLKLG